MKRTIGVLVLVGSIALACSSSDVTVPASGPASTIVDGSAPPATVPTGDPEQHDASTMADAGNDAATPPPPTCAGAGAACSASSCATGSIACPNGAAPSCIAVANLPAGQPCGNDEVCDGSGACVACTAGASCRPLAACHKGHLQSCSGRADACIDEGTNAEDGTSCGADKVCSGGACIGCIAGAACTPADPCHNGITSCLTGASVCVDQGTAALDGSVCGAAGSGQLCAAGSCGCAGSARLCDGVCRAYDDPAHCGRACSACTAPAGQTAACLPGASVDTCGISCGGITCVGSDQCNGTQCACGNGPGCGLGATCTGGACTCDRTCNAYGGCCNGNVCVLPRQQNPSFCPAAFGFSGILAAQCVDCRPVGDSCVEGRGCSCGYAQPNQSLFQCVPSQSVCHSGRSGTVDDSTCVRLSAGP